MQRELFKCLSTKFLKRFSWFTDDINIYTDIPTSKGLPILGTTLSLLAAGAAPKLHHYIDSRHRQFGPIFRETIGNMTGIFLSDASDMRQVIAQEGKYPTHALPEAWTLYNRKYSCSRGLFFMNGEEWYHFRRKMNKILLSSNTTEWIYSPCMEVAHNIVDRWKENLKVNTCFKIDNLESELYRWSIDVMIAILLGSSYAKYKPILGQVTDKLSKVVYYVFETSSKLNVLPVSLMERLRLRPWLNFTDSVHQTLDISADYANACLYKKVKEKNHWIGKRSKIPNNLLDIIFKECELTDGLIDKMHQANIPEEQIRKIVIDLILAAGDTTAYSMEWILLQLSKRKDIQDKVLESIRNTENPLDRPAYLKCVIKETLRLYPVAPFLSRYIPHDINIRGYNIPKNSLMIISLYTMSRDPNYFKDADKFWPERWLRKEDNIQQLNGALNSACIPFSMGSRSCIGRKIAETQMYITLTKLIENFYIENVNEEKIEMILRLVSVPSTPIKLRVTNR